MQIEFGHDTYTVTPVGKFILWVVSIIAIVTLLTGACSQGVGMSRGERRAMKRCAEAKVAIEQISMNDAVVDCADEWEEW